jgi:hypothetical protein
MDTYASIPYKFEHSIQPHFYTQVSNSKALFLRFFIHTTSSSTQPCLYFPMLFYNPLLILHWKTYKILVCFDPTVLGGQRPQLRQI